MPAITKGNYPELTLQDLAKEMYERGRTFNLVDELAQEVDLSPKGLRAYTDQYKDRLPLPVFALKISGNQYAMIVFRDEWEDWKQRFKARIQTRTVGGKYHGVIERQPARGYENEMDVLDLTHMHDK